MNKIERLTKEIEDLKKQKIEAEKLIKNTESKISINNKEIANAYKEFFNNLTNKEFILYERFPSMKALDIFRSYDKFPLYDEGILNAKELAEIIKHIYQFKTGKEYNILSIGVTETDGMPIYGGKVYQIVPHLHFIIGNDKTLEPYKEFSGKFINNDRLYSKIYLYAKGKDIINIELERDSKNSLGINCLTEKFSDKDNEINYYDAQYNEYSYVGFDLHKRIFNDSIHNPKGIRDVFNFEINTFDTYIAKTLISIIIYKRNNNIKELSDEDYNYIFDTLFNEKVNIVEDAKKDIPNELIYVPSEKYGK